jgi:YD repeat-containing protein
VTTVYDAFGQFPKTVTNAEGESENYVYDRKFGNKLSLTGPNGLITSWTYDGFGRLLKETRADATQTLTAYKWCNIDCPMGALYFVMTQTTGGAPITEYFDALGRKLRTRAVGFDGRYIHTDTVYNNLGQIAKVSEPYFEGETLYWTYSQYDAIDRIITLTPPLTPEVKTEYNGLTTRMKRLVSGTWRIESETKNIIGQTESVTNAAGTTLLYTYDSQGNLKTTETSGRPDTRITVIYDLLGRKTRMIDPDMGTWNYQYNGYGDLVSQTNALGQTVTMKYDRLGRLVQRTEPEGVSDWVYGRASTYPITAISAN